MLAATRRVLPIVVLVLSMAVPAAAVSVNVPGTANIFGSGHSIPPAPDGGGGGTPSPMTLLPAGPFRVIQFDSVTGIVGCCGNLPGVENGPDGGFFGGPPTDILSYGGIGGIIHRQRTLFLVGVFLDDSEPADPAPLRLDFGGGGIEDNFAELSPQLRQVFFIGDGLTGTGTGTAQVFRVPAGATRFFLGFADSFDFGHPSSYPGWYDDNIGSLSATFTVSTSPTGTVRSSWGTLKGIYR